MKKYLLALIPFIIGIGCMIAYSTIEVKIALDGNLGEPFFLLAIGYLFLAIGIIIGLVVSIMSLYRNTKKNN
ncbi:DUF3955 domain-containing protein [Clostridium gasigenes]|uniref:DUF3955 domain-containing protein n=1 Tax=Clostridium gasigenes TaxID=94869 RepID=A0A7X0SEX3_9CLOT|nr:DUF3955 domain-containing protein [Clostridium gasigenes]MBB6714296.1 DUF3955 domain-containing protein [Clostridium gasigenes]